MSATLTALLVGGLLLFAGGGVTGWAVSRSEAADVLEQQTLLIADIQDAQARTLEQVSKPLVLDAELRGALAEVPPACLTAVGGDPMSPTCLLVECWRRGQSSAQRPECRAVEQAVLAQLKCGNSE